MDTNLLFIGLIGIVTNAMILYLVISSATKSSQRSKYEWAQLEMLAKIARVQGVPEEEIKQTFKQIS